MEEKEHNLREQSSRLNSREEFIAWEQQCNEYIKSLEENSQHSQSSIGNEQRLVARIARLEDLKNSLRGHFVHADAGYSAREDDTGLRWHEINTAFQERILTGAVINSKHIEPRQFLREASSIVLKHVRKFMLKYEHIKINTVFNGEFVAGDKRANKSINTRIYELFCLSKLEEWYNLHIIEPTLASLEEFQERDSGWTLSRILDLTVNMNECKYFCDQCLHDFSSNKELTHTCQKKTEKCLSFKNYSRKERVPFVVYADLRCILEKTEKGDPKTSSYTCQQRRILSIGYYVHCSYDDSLSMYRFRRDKDCVTWFTEELRDLAHRVKSILSANVPMADFTSDEREKFSCAMHCHVCEKPFARNDIRARDHCHLTGQYRGPAHKTCNLNYKIPYSIPVVFYNLSGYDAHFIIEKLTVAYEGQIELLPITKEHYISFTKTVKIKNINGQSKNMKLHFIDSCRFINIGLDKLVSFLSKDKLRILQRAFHNLSIENFDLLTRKGVFPYKYIDCVKKFEELRLPPRESFYSSLTGDIVSESDYAHAVNVWQRFFIRTLGGYSDLCLKTDVLLLADMFENFRENCIERYGLDPAHYDTLPSFTWDAMLKHTGINIELLTDIDMIMFIERGVRGGLSQCSNRYAQANNKYIQLYDPSKPTSYLMYFKIHNLYDWAMRQPLPYKDFRWINDGDVSNFDVKAVAIDSPTGYILEVDLEYPLYLHDAHTDLPFCPTRDKRQDKLFATLNNKKNYIIHYRNLQQCVRRDLRVTKIHRILAFTQSPWLLKYIELNTKYENNYEKNLYELMKNAIFDETMENVRDQVDVRLVTKWDGRYGARAMIAKPNFHDRSVFSKNMVAIEMRKPEVKFDKPIYVGMCIRDISKICLYEFHHEYMLPLYRAKCKVMYTDTDSLIYHIECDDVYDNMVRDIDRFILLANEKVPGLMKDESNGAIMTEFVGLRAKMYALRFDDKEDTKKVKSVESNVVAKSITFDDYTRCLREKSHETYTVSETKIALSPYDDKRYIIPDSTETLPRGHYKINKKPL